LFIARRFQSKSPSLRSKIARLLGVARLTLAWAQLCFSEGVGGGAMCPALKKKLFINSFFYSQLQQPSTQLE